MTENHGVEIINIMLASLDGKIAKHKGESTGTRNKNGFASQADFEHMRKLVATCDAVFVGWRTMASERGAFRVADLRPAGDEPLWVVFSRTGEINLSHDFWKQPKIPRAVAFCTHWDSHEPPMARSDHRDLLSTSTQFLVGNANGIISMLSKNGIKKIALLGGGELNALFWDAHLVSKIHLTLSPSFASVPGSVSLMQGLKSHVPLQLVACENHHGFLFLEYIPGSES